MFDQSVLDDDGFISAWNIVSGEVAGAKFDYDAMAWKTKP
jgi:hypothetical protein